jgi:arginine deiminase
MATFIFRAKEGKMTWETPYNHDRFLQNLRENEGKPYRIEPLISTRSMSQNSLYWLYLEVIQRETGNQATELHEYFKRELLPPKFIKVKIKGKEIERKIPASTTELKKNEFIDYLDKISALCGVAIPDTESWKGWRDSSPLVGETYKE